MGKIPHIIKYFKTLTGILCSIITEHLLGYAMCYKYLLHSFNDIYRLGIRRPRYFYRLRVVVNYTIVQFKKMICNFYPGILRNMTRYTSFSTLFISTIKTGILRNMTRYTSFSTLFISTIKTGILRNMMRNTSFSTLFISTIKTGILRNMMRYTSFSTLFRLSRQVYYGI